VCAKDFPSLPTHSHYFIFEAVLWDGLLWVFVPEEVFPLSALQSLKRMSGRSRKWLLSPLYLSHFSSAVHFSYSQSQVLFWTPHFGGLLS